jgi:hypothetical protein
LKKSSRPLTHIDARRYWSGMTSFSVWGTTLVAITVAGAALAGCGETSNFVGNLPEGGGSGGTTSNAGSSNGGSAPHGGTTASAGTTSSGGKSSSGGTGLGGDAPLAGTTSTGGSVATGGTGTGGVPGNCTPLSGNWISCDQGQGLVHRTAPGKCDSKLPHAEALQPIDPQLDECTKDTECTAKPNGYCAVFYPGFTNTKRHNYCAYGCLTDADCGQGQACQCGSEIGECTSATTCKSDEDCQGGLCLQFDSCPGVPAYDFACQTPSDQCATNTQCRESDAGKQFCTVVGNDNHRECDGVQCAI